MKEQLVALKAIQEAINFGVGACLEPDELPTYGLYADRLNMQIKILEAKIFLQEVGAGES